MSDEKSFKVSDSRGKEKEKKPDPIEQKKESLEENQDGNEQEGGLPDANFVNFTASLGTSAMIHLGLMKNPQTNQEEKNLEMAKHEIDLLSMLQEKTKNNLSKEEENFMTQMLYELRLHYVKNTK